MYIIGISACPTGIAHTYMAADAIEHAAANIGADFKVETQGYRKSRFNCNYCCSCC